MHLNEIEVLLRQGMRLSRQGRLDRRAPDPRAIPILSEARQCLKEIATEDCRDAQVWELLSLAEECLLNYRQALVCLEVAIEIKGVLDKKSRKRLAMLRSGVEFWRNLPLSPDQISRLGGHLERVGANDIVDEHPLARTEEWLHSENVANSEEVISALVKSGIDSDVEVLRKVVTY